MKKEINIIIYNGVQVCNFATEHLTTFKPYGIDENYINDVTVKLNVLSGFEKEFFKKETMKRELTRSINRQNEILKRQISILQNFAKFRIQDKRAQELFFVGKNIGRTFAGILAESEQILKASKEFENELKNKNFQMEVIENITKQIEELRQADIKQEAMKKELKKFREDRDKIAEEVHGMIRYIQKVGLIAFKDDPMIRDKFFNLIKESKNKIQNNENNTNENNTAESSKID